MNPEQTPNNLYNEMTAMVEKMRQDLEEIEAYFLSLRYYNFKCKVRLTILKALSYYTLFLTCTFSISQLP